MEKLRKKFSDREDLIAFVKALSPSAIGDASPIRGGYDHARDLLCKIDPINYSRTRNFGDGKITKLSPYIHHGVIDLNQVRNYALDKCSEPEQSSKFIQELGWRDFWQRVADKNPHWLWEDVESYKTGFLPEDYEAKLPDDIATGNTGVACIDSFISDLLNTGYVHNHARMYLASFVVHFRRVKWQAGAEWFLEHLLDGDEASNNLSWQWVASTFSNKPYIFNLENVDKYFGKFVDTTPENNKILDLSYEELSARLFPYIGANCG
ncbi:MAG: FAD-binding domain-containing protein [Gammaproteobacteria bacterium]|nr:FAD-binding domain-containing protein [Gammaproteobacteria bacterium]